LQAVAESALAEAAAEVERATAKVAVAEAKAAAAVAQKGHFNAVIEAAQSNYEVLDKTYTRLRELATAEKSVPARQVDEAQEKLAAAKATLAGARAAAATGGANIDESKAAVAEARAELQIAETRRRAAQARLDRLTRQAASEPGEEFAPGADSSQPQDSRRKQSEPAGDREAAE
jgi:multidrug resistance efflux pump